MIKSELITWIAGLTDDAPDLLNIDAIRRGIDHQHADDGRAMTITDVAMRSGYARPSIYRAIKAGTLKAFRPYPGGRLRITQGAFSRWMTDRQGDDVVHENN